MEYTCDECYNLRQKSIEKCPLCGRNTFEGRVIGWSNCMMCTNCGMQVASAGGYPESCHTDDREYRIERLQRNIIIIFIWLQENRIIKKKLLV